MKNTAAVKEQDGLCGRCRALVFSPLQVKVNPGQFCPPCQARIQRMLEASIVASLAPGERAGQ